MIPIVLSFTPNYFIPACVCLKSILDASRETDRFEVICLLSEPLFTKQIDLLEKLSLKKQFCFRYIELDNSLDYIKVSSRFSKASLFRMVLPNLLPTYDNVIYLDCDIIVRQNLSDLYKNINLSNNYLGVVYEATLPSQYQMVKNIDCLPGKYFNSGFLVMNLNSMRKDNISALLLEEATKNYSEFLDQDVLNKVCKGRALPLEPKYNFNRTMILPQYKDIFLSYYTIDEWNNGISGGNIHYTGGKPWNEYTVMYSLWWDVYFSLPDDLQRYLIPSKKQLILYKLEKNTISNYVLESLRKLKRILS